MSGYKSVAHVMATIGSSNRSARVLRFVYRHRRKHRGIIGVLRRAQQRHQRRVDKRFLAMQKGK